MIPRTKSCACHHAGMHHGADGCRLCPCVKFAHPSVRLMGEGGSGAMPATGSWRHGRVLGRNHPTRDAA